MPREAESASPSQLVPVTVTVAGPGGVSVGIVTVMVTTPASLATPEPRTSPLSKRVTVEPGRKHSPSKVAVSPGE